MYLGIDVGTSGVTAVLVDDDQQVVASHKVVLLGSAPESRWSEQAPEDWWNAAQTAVQEVAAKSNPGLSKVRAIGLTGQMHGATLLGPDGEVLRPAILWNDTRSAAECGELERLVPNSRKITGNVAMPGFTAPMLMWVAENEPEVFDSLSKVLLPKDYLRLRLSGETATDLSDAGGTLWLDVAERSWSDKLLEASGLTTDHVPTLFEGNEITGRLRAKLARDWGLEEVPIAAGASDNAAGALAAGVFERGRALLSLGQSAAYFTPSDAFIAAPENAINSFCHCLPGRWHQLSVVRNVRSCFSWLARILGSSEPDLWKEAHEQRRYRSEVLFLPYLSGEQTPHSDPQARGVFFGLADATSRADLVHAVLEGVVFAITDAHTAVTAAGTKIEQVDVIGDASMAKVWTPWLANSLRLPVDFRCMETRSPAFGAARLARLAVTREAPETVCLAPPSLCRAEPDPTLIDRTEERLTRFRRLYTKVRGEFTSSA